MTTALPPTALPLAAIDDPTYRLIPSRFPPISAFATVSSPADLAAIMELEGWTNDRLVKERLARLPQSDWVFGTPNASIVMAAFLHAPESGLRFSSGALGAWYGATTVNTAIAEVAYHLRREVMRAGMAEILGEYRAYQAGLHGSYVDIRGMQHSRPELYAQADYSASQRFGELVRSSADAGIVFDSVRYLGGINNVCYRPRAIHRVVQTEHYEITVRPIGKIPVRRLP